MSGLSPTGPHPRSARVRQRREFVRIQQRGLRVHTQAFTIVAAPGEGERPRLGVAVSRRIGNAVVRARVRRLIREVFRRIAARLPVVDVVVVAKPSSSALTQGGLDRVATMLIPAIEKACGRVAPHAPEGPKE